MRNKIKYKRVNKWKEIRFEPHEKNEIINVPANRHKLDSRQITAANERWKDVKSCMTCGRPFGKGKAHIDHCHVSGVIRGKLCYRCNVAIGLMRDDVYIAHSVLKHLEYFKYNPDMVEPDMWGKNVSDKIDEGF